MEKEQFITKMEQALAEVNQVKQQLQRNAADVKSQIHSGISRQLEALRNREVWLLNQVELIQNMKDEVLHLQQARLNKMLGVAQSGLTDSLENDFADIDDLKPDENPWIVFKSDSAKLRESITSYGKVESGSRPSAFVKPGLPARSLPPHFEDYDDADHHVLYKTVEGVTKSTQDTTVTFTIPKLSSASKDWLAYSTTTTSETNVKPRFSYPGMAFSNQHWLKSTSSDVKSNSASPMSSVSSGSWQLSNRDTDASIQMWLKDIKQNPIIEDEDDFEVISKRDFIGMDKQPRKVSMSSSYSAPDLKYADNETWLKPVTAGQTNAVKSFKLPSHLENSSTETWLCRKWKRNAKSGCGEQCGQTSPPEIENICDYLDEKIWVKSYSSDNRQMEVCKANEPCEGPDECLATPHCFYSINHDDALHSDTNKWLLNGGKNVKSTTPVHCKMFEQFRVPPIEEKDNMWLKGSNLPQRNLDDWKTNPIQMEENIWIKQSSDVFPDSTTTFSSSTTWDKVMAFHNEIGKDQWILKEKDTTHEKKSEDNPWILKSSCNVSEKSEDNPWILKSSCNVSEKSENDPWILTRRDESMDILQ